MMQVSVVTGAAGAMGSACAQTLGASSDVLFLTDRDEAGLAATAAVLEADGTTVVTIVGDVADPLVIDALVRRVADCGALRALVHTAGLSPSMAAFVSGCDLRVDGGLIAAMNQSAPARTACR
jgi:NAD(P)-dependent dehydrogenase (short-subunit alcohol dehydrogenase family)